MVLYSTAYFVTNTVIFYDLDAMLILSSDWYNFFMLKWFKKITFINMNYIILWRRNGNNFEKELWICVLSFSLIVSMLFWEKCDDFLLKKHFKVIIVKSPMDALSLTTSRVLEMFASWLRATSARNQLIGNTCTNG